MDAVGQVCCHALNDRQEQASSLSSMWRSAHGAGRLAPRPVDSDAGSHSAPSLASEVRANLLIRRRVRTCAGGRPALPHQGVRRFSVRSHVSWAGTAAVNWCCQASYTRVARVVIPSPRPGVALAVAAVPCQGWRSHRLRPEVLDGAATVRLTSGRSGRWDRHLGNLPRISDPRPGVRGGAP